jgi:hypothetical protein
VSEKVTTFFAAFMLLTARYDATPQN